MKKHVILVLALLLTMVFGMSTLTTSTAHAATDSSLTKLQKKGTLVMGTSPDYPPYEFQATVHGKTKIVGMDVAVGEKIAKDLGVKLVVKSMSFDSLLVALQTGKVDMVISGMNPTAARKKALISPTPTIRVAIVSSSTRTIGASIKIKIPLSARPSGPRLVQRCITNLKSKPQAQPLKV